MINTEASPPSNPILIIRGFEPGAFGLEVYKMVKMYDFVEDMNQLPSDWMSSMLPLSYQNEYNPTIILFISSKHMLLYYWPGQPLSFRLLHNLSGPPFSPKKQWRLFALASVSNQASSMVCCLIWSGPWFGKVLVWMYYRVLIAKIQNCMHLK